MATTDVPVSILVDGIESLGVHNGVARIRFMKLAADGKGIPAVELLVPTNQLRGIVDGLMKAVR